MIIETWIAVLCILFIFISGMIGLLGWTSASNQYEKERDLNRELEEKNEKLLAECIRLKAVVSFYKLQKDMEDDKE